MFQGLQGRARRTAAAIVAMVLGLALAGPGALLPAQASGGAGDDGSQRLLQLISRADYPALARLTCSPQGLAFAPYARNLATLQMTRLSRDDLQRFARSAQPVDWGRYDGSGQPILLAPMAYHRQFVYDIDYRRLATLTRLSTRQLQADAELRAVAAAFPQSEALVYRFAGTADLGHKDRRDLILVGRRAGGQWCLDALAHDEDTV